VTWDLDRNVLWFQSIWSNICDLALSFFIVICRRLSLCIYSTNNFVIGSETTPTTNSVTFLYTMLRKCGVERSAITSSTVNEFWKFFTVANSNKLSTNNIFRRFLKISLYYRAKHNSFKLLRLFYHSLMTKLSTLCIHLKKHITLLNYLLPCPATRVLVTSLRRIGTVGHLARPSTECSLQLIAQLMESSSSRLRTGQRRTFWALTIC